jgi:hypothetical protein
LAEFKTVQTTWFTRAVDLPPAAQAPSPREAILRLQELNRKLEAERGTMQSMPARDLTDAPVD